MDSSPAHEVESARILTEALDVIGKGGYISGVDMVFNRIEAAEDERAEEFAMFRSIAQLIVTFGLGIGGTFDFVAEKQLMNMGDPDVAIPTWCMRFITARANEDELMERALYDSMTPESASACMGYILGMCATVVKQERARAC